MPEHSENPFLIRLHRETERYGIHWRAYVWSVACLAAFCLVVVLVAFHVLLPVDISLMRVITRLHNADFDMLTGVSNYLAAAEVTLTAMMVLSFALWWNGVPRWRAAAPMLFLFSLPIEFALKFGLNQPPPSTEFYRETLRYSLASFDGVMHSFPSGHGTRTMFMVVVLSYLVAIRLHGFRLLSARLALGAFVLLSALTKTYQGHHWPSDMLGGFLLGAGLGLATISVLARSVERICQRKHQSPGPREENRVVLAGRS